MEIDRIRTRDLVTGTLIQFKVSPCKKQSLNLIKGYLNIHNQSINSIGIGYSDIYITAAKIFLRLINLYKIQ